MFRGGARTVMEHSYAHVPNNSIPRSTFMMGNGCKTTMDAGLLVPVGIYEVYPGDTFQVGVEGSARLGTSITPYMDNMYLELHAHYCPLRLLWSNFEKFMGARIPNPDSSIDYVIPQVVSPVGTGYANGSFYDYIGYPTQVPELSASALPGRMMNKTWNQWYRDENLQNSVVENTGDGPDTYTDTVLLRRGKRKDYFTSCLPFAQKGAAVEIPLLGTAPVTGIGMFDGNNVTTYAGVMRDTAGNVSVANTTPLLTFSTNGAIQFASTGPSGASRLPQIYADLSGATGANINDFRKAATVQQLLEIDARGGTRYVELLKSHFNVISPDFRLQRVEFLGGETLPVIVTPIAQTSESGSTPLGNLAAIGTVGFSGRPLFDKSFVEHGIIMILATVRADLNYQQGLNRSWSRRTRYDFYFPTFANLGEQAVLNKEIYAVGSAVAGQDDLVFGYQEPWGDLRSIPSRITGQFRSNFAQTLDIWHLAQYFTSLPTLNSTFIQENPPVDRIKAVADDYPDFLVDLWFSMKVTREIPIYGIPGLHKL
jgi:hypothetical protein